MLILLGMEQNLRFLILKVTLFIIINYFSRRGDSSVGVMEGLSVPARRVSARGGDGLGEPWSEMGGLRARWLWFDSD